MSSNATSSPSSTTLRPSTRSGTLSSSGVGTGDVPAAAAEHPQLAAGDIGDSPNPSHLNSIARPAPGVGSPRVASIGSMGSGRNCGGAVLIRSRLHHRGVPGPAWRSASHRPAGRPGTQRVRQRRPDATRRHGGVPRSRWRAAADLGPHCLNVQQLLLRHRHDLQ